MGFQYWICLNGRRGEPYIYEDVVSWFVPRAMIERCYDQFVDQKLHLCGGECGCLCHVIEKETGKKYCPILFVELVEPKWRLKDVVRSL